LLNQTFGNANGCQTGDRNPNDQSPIAGSDRRFAPAAAYDRRTG
jgi:hypothetical protein